MDTETRKYPKLIVLDCDMCLWSPEMYTLGSLPTEKVQGKLKPGLEGVVGARNKDGDEVRLFPGALKVLQDFAEGKFGRDTKLAAASSADTPFAVKCALESFKILEVLPGVSMKELFERGFEKGFSGNLQIGRSGKLSSNKVTHFKELKRETGIDFDEMVFFDDCNWGDNCAVVARGCKGVTTQKTPNGLTYAEFEEAIEKFNAKKKC